MQRKMVEEIQPIFPLFQILTSCCGAVFMCSLWCQLLNWNVVASFTIVLPSIGPDAIGWHYGRLATNPGYVGSNKRITTSHIGKMEGLLGWFTIDHNAASYRRLQEHRTDPDPINPEVFYQGAISRKSINTIKIPTLHLYWSGAGGQPPKSQHQ